MVILKSQMLCDAMEKLFPGHHALKPQYVRDYYKPGCRTRQKRQPTK